MDLFRISIAQECQQMMQRQFRRTIIHVDVRHGSSEELKNQQINIILFPDPKA